MTTYAFDPEIAAVLPHLPDLPGTDPLAIRAAMSEMIAALPVPDATGLQIENREIPGRDGDPAVPIRIYRPNQPSAPAAVYSVHGGGFIAGDLETEHGSSVVLARELGVVVVSVDYRLAPETPFPGGLEDVYAGLVWMAAHADELGIDPQRIAIHGMSAGGGLCAALALLARDRGGPHIAFQFLSVPELDDRLITASMTDFTDTPLWSRPRAILSWDCYLGAGRAGTDDVPVYAAPARATDLAGLPPAYVSVMHFDPLRDEGVAYALAMLAAGVSVELHLFPGTFHGSMLIQDAAISKREEAEKITVLRRALAL
ncbi:esterase [Mycobacterium florentinum]|uniref:Esterase n=1 Tax=Mycobacterium florentinum TaxID=292462 RepID=A0A1X1U5X4_MYCFL|nr:alpha/beta hydrolase [Mycobacterium florentinum]MCV7410317.1 alpha/beta hydrolase [Mycobacterium florentinum]ORV52088.1 esterase [Mycobacterium florentinum]BBX79634.1 esterase [Mycobacterium florentinum]